MVKPPSSPATHVRRFVDPEVKIVFRHWTFAAPFRARKDEQPVQHVGGPEREGALDDGTLSSLENVVIGRQLVQRRPICRDVDEQKIWLTIFSVKYFCF